MICPNELDHLDTAALTGGGGGHVMLKGENFKNLLHILKYVQTKQLRNHLQIQLFYMGKKLLLDRTFICSEEKNLGISPIPGVMAPWVVPRVAVKTVNCVPGYQQYNDNG